MALRALVTALGAVVALSVACGDEGGEPQVLPTGGGQLVLRLEMGGGLVPFGFLELSVPAFSLYGDGTAVYRAFDPGSGTSQLRQVTLPPEAVDDLVQTVVDDYAFFAKAPSYDELTAWVADGSTSVITVHAQGKARTVSVYALGLDSSLLEELPTERRAEYRDLQAIQELLLGFEPGDYDLASSPYAPPGGTVLAQKAEETACPGQPTPWPLPGVELSGLAAQAVEGDFGRGSVDATGAATLLETVGLERFLCVQQGGLVYIVGFRPDLPDDGAR